MCTCLREAGATITGSELHSFGKLKGQVQFFVQLYLQNSLKYDNTVCEYSYLVLLFLVQYNYC